MNDDEEYGIPKHMVHAFQIHRDHETITEHSEDDIDFTYYQRNFHVGSLVNFTIQSASPSLEPNNEDWNLIINPASFHVGQGARLCIDTVAIDPATVGLNSSNMTLFVSSDVNPDYTPICPFISFSKPVFTSLGLEIVGPSLLRFALVNHSDSDTASPIEEQLCINVFGKVQLVSDQEQEAILKAKLQFIEIEENEAIYDESDFDEEDTHDDTTPLTYIKEMDNLGKENDEDCDKQYLDTTKRKLSEASLNESMENEGEVVVKLSKKQRKLLAKQKEKELNDAIAKDNNHSIQSQNMNSDYQKSEKISLTKPRLLNGVLVQDIIHGTGPTVKIGRKVSIHYVGKLSANGKIFDKNSSKSNPLIFRVGTGEVIKGLDRGIENMRVGGARIIKIPSALAYGKRGNSNIPANSDLEFEVKVISTGGK